MGSVCLLVGSEENRGKLDDTYVRLASSPGRREADTTLAFEGLCGISLVVDHTESIERMGLRAYGYAKAKMEEHGYSIWVVIMEGLDRELKVQIIPRDDIGMLAEHLMTPSSQRSSL